ncbi:MAG: flavodoxin [Ruminococcus sp.]|nr:flavodoxin [Ruminococcus sp.]
MSKVAVVFWTGTGNTEAMANAVAEGAKEKGADVTLTNVSDFDISTVSTYDSIAFGCPAMGAEELEDSEFEPAFNACDITGKNVALFGSYGWGDGEWMRNWEDTCKTKGANLVSESVICNDVPDDEATANCKALGAALA